MLNHALISELEAIQQADDAAEVMLTNGRVLRGWPNAAGMRSAGVLVLGDHGKDAGELNCIVILASQVVAVGWAELTPEEYDHGKPADERDPHIVGFGLVGTEGK